MYIEPSLRGLLTVFFRRKAKFASVFGFIVFVGMAYLLTMTRVYDAHGSFLIKSGQGVPDVSKSGASSDDSTPSAHSELIQSNINIVQSDDLLATVIKKVGVERLYPNIKKEVAGTDSLEHEAILRLQKKDLKVTNDAESSIVDVVVQNKDPQVAQEFAASLIEAFITRQTEIYGAPQSDFLEKQITDAKQKLEESQKKFQDFKQQVGISNLDQEVTELLAEKTALSGFSLQAVTAAEQDLTKLESDQAAAVATYKSESPIIQRLNDSIAVAKREVSKRQQDLNASGRDGSALSPKIAKIDKRMAYLEQYRGQYTQLEEAVQMNEDDYKNYRQQGEEARGNQLLGEQGITRIAIVDNPVVPIKSEPLRRALLLIAILLTGTLLGMGTIIFSELTDESVAYPEQIAFSAGLPVLATFGRIQTA